MNFLDSRIESYLDTINSSSPAPLDAMERYAQEHRFPIIGPLVGKILQQLVTLTKASAVFELGSGYGYSALWMALAMGDGGEIVCTDLKRANANLAKDYFTAAGQDAKLDFRIGEAIEIFSKETGSFDIVLNDIDKEDYPATIELVKERLRPGGVFITDNVLWGGKILDERPDPETAAIQKFNRMLFEDADFTTSIIPLRDGITLAVKK